jgi:formamidopyrimidine-DNA glycosylase
VPELPDIVLYLERLEPRIVGLPLSRVHLLSPFFLRTFDPPLAAAQGRTVTGLSRLGKRIVWKLSGDLSLVFHLMIAGRFHWKPPGAPTPKGKNSLAAFDFPTGTVLVTETGSKKRASLKLLAGRAAVEAEDRGGLEPLTADLASFRAALGRESHTLKRALTDPRIFSGIGNAYSDEILHRARLSPFKRTVDLKEEESARLFAATQAVLTTWIERLRAEAAESFPEKVTSSHPGFAVHARYNQPCPDCGAPVQRILYAENEANYCAVCQTGGKLLADRVLSQLLKSDWPKTLDELEERRAARTPGP